MAQNMGKAENMVCFRGPRSNVETAKTEERNLAPNKGVTCAHAKYLGNISHYTGKTQMNTERRRKAFREGYYLIQTFLQCKELEMRIRRPVFLNLVFNTFLSGLEPEQVHFSELKACDQEMIKYMRKMLQTNASITLQTGENAGRRTRKSER